MHARLSQLTLLLATLVLTAAVRADELSFPSYGCSFSPPPGWISALRHGGKQIGRWAKVDDKGKTVALVSVEIARTGTDNLREIASRWATPLGGATAIDAVKLDGDDAIRATVKYAGPGLKPIGAIFTFHDKALYVIYIGVSDANADVKAALETVRASWKWQPVVHPSTLFSKTASVPIKGSGGLDLEAPTVVAELDPLKDSPSLHLAIWNQATTSEEALYLFQVVQTGDKQAFSDRIDKFRDQLNAKGITSTPLEWKTRDEKAKVAVSNMMATKSDKADPPRSMFVLRELADGTFIICNATLMTADEKLLSAYSDLGLQMTKSIMGAPKKR
jgi:hypothetical protein